MKISSAYLDWLKSETIETDLGNGYTEITVPFLDRHNDYIQIYVKKSADDIFRLSDDTYTITDLQMSGMDFKSVKRKKILNDIVRKRGIKYDDNTDELFIEAHKSRLGEAQHQLFQSMLDINDLFYLNKSAVKTFFFEDVEAYFNKHSIYFSKDIEIKGKSGYAQSFEFLLQRNATHPERFVKLLNNPVRSSIERFIFSWTDIKENRDQESKLIVMINDVERDVSEHISHLKEYDIDGMPWSQKDKCVGMFA